MKTYPGPAGEYHAIRCAGPRDCSCTPIVVLDRRTARELLARLYAVVWPANEADAGADGIGMVRS